MSKKVKGYKVFNSDWTCRGFKYKVGKTYTHKGRIGLCETGFHFCMNVADCFNYYSFYPKKKVAEVIAHGKTISGDHKVVTDKIEIVREVNTFLAKSAIQNNVGLRENAALYAKLPPAMQRIGANTAATNQVVDAFGKSLRIGGATAMEAASATIQFAQAMASGKLAGDEFRAISEASPRFLKAIADGSGIAAEKLKEMSSEGALTTEVIARALVKEYHNLTKESESLGYTLEQGTNASGSVRSNTKESPSFLSSFNFCVESGIFVKNWISLTTSGETFSSNSSMIYIGFIVTGKQIGRAHV